MLEREVQKQALLLRESDIEAPIDRGSRKTARNGLGRKGPRRAAIQNSPELIEDDDGREQSALVGADQFDVVCELCVQ